MSKQLKVASDLSEILCVYLSVESMCILFWFYSSLNACLHPRACFLLTCDHQNIEKSPLPPTAKGLFTQM